jgi:hypothetical protein
LEKALETIKKYKTQLAEKDQQNQEIALQLAKKDQQNQEIALQLAKKDQQNQEIALQLAEKDQQNQEIALQLAEKDRQIAAKSLHGVLIGEGIQKLGCTGSSSTNLNPTNHQAAACVKKKFVLLDVITFVQGLKQKTQLDPALETIGSGLLLKFLRPPVEQPHTYQTEADVAYYVNLAMDDATVICNAIVSMISALSSSVKEPATLVVRQEMSIFSNRCDHAIVYDRTSNAPIFCVETKKHFPPDFDKEEKNKSWGQVYDQLKAMSVLGHPCAFGALTSFNETYVTQLCPGMEWNVPPTLESLQSPVSRLPGTTPHKMTQSPLKVEQAVNNHSTSNHAMGFVMDKNRGVIRSQDFIDAKCIVSAFVIMILHALKVNYEPKTFYKFTDGQLVVVDCLQMKETSYKWGRLHTTYKGPCTRDIRRRPWFFPKKDLYLMDCIGTGSTSKAYYATTEDGYDCVVKIYVQQHDKDGSMKTLQKFRRDSKTHVTNEEKNYRKIYKNELDDYVWTEKMNHMHCIIMPFFAPIQDRKAEQTQTSIVDRLKLFTEEKLAFRKDDQRWRHIGRFNEKLYMFDLGDLEECASKEVAATCAQEHMTSLNARNPK